MSEKNLMICDREILFAERLGENVSLRNEFALNVYTCSSVENVLRFQKKKKIHMLIMDERFLGEERSKIEAEQIYVLTKDHCRDLRQGEKEVFKFQSADRILAEILEVYYENTNDNVMKSVKKEKPRLIAVYSPIHRIGKTTFALTFGKEMAAKEKTLYLNLEEYADIGGRFEKSEGRNLGDLIYFMRQEEENFPLRLSNMIQKMEELDYVSPMPDCLDLKEISADDWKRLLEKILAESVYRTVLLDVSESVQGLYEVLQMCDKIYMPVLEDTVSINRIYNYEENVKRLSFHDILNKTYRFVVSADMGRYNIEEYARSMAREE